MLPPTLRTISGQTQSDDEDWETVKANALVRLYLWCRRALYSLVAFVAACCLLFPFLDGQPWHAYWERIGKYLIVLAMAGLIAALYMTLMWWGAWRALRDLEQFRHE